MGREVWGEEMTKIEKLAEYQYQIQRQAIEIIMQSNPFTAYGEGLDRISRALGLGGRFDVEDPDSQSAIPGIRSETDVELRERIVEYLSIAD
jgi:hypothetical protein